MMMACVNRIIDGRCDVAHSTGCAICVQGLLGLEYSFSSSDGGQLFLLEQWRPLAMLALSTRTVTSTVLIVSCW